MEKNEQMHHTIVKNDFWKQSTQRSDRKLCYDRKHMKTDFQTDLKYEKNKFNNRVFNTKLFVKNHKPTRIDPVVTLADSFYLKY